MNPYSEMRTESTDKSQNDLEHGIGDWSRSSHPPATTANHVHWTGRVFIPICLILVIGLSVKLLILEQRVNHLEQMMATAPRRGEVAQKTVLAWFPNSGDRTPMNSDLVARDQTEIVNDVGKSLLTSFFATDNEDGNPEDDVSFEPRRTRRM